MSNLGIRIQQRRKELKMSGQELAGLIGLSQAIISKYERGEKKPSIKNLEALASALGVSVGYLMGEDEPRTEDAPTVKEDAAPVQQSDGTELATRAWAFVSELKNADMNLRQSNSTRDALNEALDIVEKKLSALSSTESSPNTQSCAEPLSVSA